MAGATRKKKSGAAQHSLSALLWRGFGVLVVTAVGLYFLTRNTSLPTVNPPPTIRPTTFSSSTPSMSVPIAAEDVFIAAKSNVNIRTGPGADYERLGRLTAGETVKAVGRNAAGTWFVVEIDGVRGWVTGDDAVVAVAGSTEKLLVVAAPAPSSSLPTQTQGSGTSGGGLPGPCPKNCTACVAAGWTAEQCGKCANLDRDKDGLACYGN